MNVSRIECWRFHLSQRVSRRLRPEVVSAHCLVGGRHRSSQASCTHWTKLTNLRIVLGTARYNEVWPCVARSTGMKCVSIKGMEFQCCTQLINIHNYYPNG